MSAERLIQKTCNHKLQIGGDSERYRQRVISDDHALQNSQFRAYRANNPVVSHLHAASAGIMVCAIVQYFLTFAEYRHRGELRRFA